MSHSLILILRTNRKTTVIQTSCSVFGRQYLNAWLFTGTLLLSVTLLSSRNRALNAAAQKPEFAVVGQNNLPTPESLDRGWVSLFDGQTLYGWRGNSKTDWQVADGAIKATEGPRGLLRTTTQFSNYELSLDFKGSAETSSAVFLRTSPTPKAVGKDSYKISIAPDDAPFSSSRKWNTMRIVLRGRLGQGFLNGQQVVTFSAADVGRGYLGLEFHENEIQFRNIFLRPLQLKPLINGGALAHWNSTQAGDSVFAFDRQRILNMKSGPGQLESKQHFADFVLSAKIKTNAAGLNSGIFFRCQPGEKLNGYESQIQNEMIDDDPSKPLDCGTGGIFRRHDARRIVAKDNQWFYKTIVAVGPHISVWVNGYQVTDWADQRPHNANPRHGLRLSAGSIMLQGHDPTTDVLFQRIDVAELLPRR